MRKHLARRVALGFFVAACAVTLAFGLSACNGGGSNPEPAPAPEPTPAPAPEPEPAAFVPFDFTDSCGRTVTITEPITRVAISGPVAQQVMLGFAPDLLVGLATKMDNAQIKYLGDWSSLPVLGQLYGGKGDLNKEAVAAAKPQIMIDWGEAKKTIVEDMDNLSTELGIPCVHIEAPIPAIASGNYLEIPGEPYNWLFGPPSVNQMLKTSGYRVRESHTMPSTWFTDGGPKSQL